MRLAYASHLGDERVYHNIVTLLDTMSRDALGDVAVRPSERNERVL